VPRLDESIVEGVPGRSIQCSVASCGDRLFQGYLSRMEAPSKSDFHDKVGQALEKMTTCGRTRSVRSCVYDGDFNRALPVTYTRLLIVIARLKPP